MDFKNITGQKELVESLKYLLTTGRIGHAYLFSGPKGTGKKTIARITAGILLCDDASEGEGCKSCKACMMFEEGTNPDFRIISTQDATIGVEAIRDMQSDITVRPMYSRRKVYLIEEADKMTESAQNCLLKTLEEPPSYAVIILTAANQEALLETVRSRTTLMRFKKYTEAEVRQALINKFGEEAEGLEVAVRYADGVIGAALELAGNSGYSKLREETIDMLTALPEKKFSAIFGFEAFFEENRDNIGFILDIMLYYYRDILAAGVTGNENMLINQDKKDMIFNNVRKYNKYNMQKIADNIRHVEEARRAVKQNANYQLVIENMLIKLQDLERNC